MIALSVFFLGCDTNDEHIEESIPSSTNRSFIKKEISDYPLDEFQVQLLDIAIEAASAIPVEPYIKDRSKAQQDVIEKCLKLDQPVRAIRYADKIENWRRGLCYAKTALYLARQGYSKEQIQKGLDIAETIAGMDHRQKWRSDRIQAEIARTYFILGMPEKARAIKNKLLESESATSETEVKTNPQLSFEKHVEALKDVIDLDSFEITHKALYGYAALFNRYYGDIEKRNSIKDAMVTRHCLTVIMAILRSAIPSKMLLTGSGSEKNYPSTFVLNCYLNWLKLPLRITITRQLLN
jgi:hypothetical protein